MSAMSPPLCRECGLHYCEECGALCNCEGELRDKQYRCEHCPDEVPSA